METEKKTNTLGYFREIFKNPKDLLTIPNMLVYLRVLLSILFLATYIGGVNVTFADHVWHWGILSPEEIDAGVGFQIDRGVSGQPFPSGAVCTLCRTKRMKSEEIWRQKRSS